jgi:hypothetical protein
MVLCEGKHTGKKDRRKERQRARETESQRDRETERQRDREAERQRGRETERQRDRGTEKQRDRETERQKYRKTERKIDGLQKAIQEVCCFRLETKVLISFRKIELFFIKRLIFFV